jgi:integrase
MSSVKRVPAGGWRARWRTPDGKSRSRTFARRVDAEKFLTSTDHAKLTGSYVDPAAGKVTFGDFARSWQAAQVHRPTTAASIDSTLRNHVFPTFETRPIASIRPSEVQAWVKGISGQIAPSTVRVVVQNLRAVLNAAVRDQVIARSPCLGLKLPADDRPQVQPLETAEVFALIEALPDRYRGLAVLGAGAGLRSGEALGVSSDELDFLRRSLSVRQQLVTLPSGEVVIAPPKTSSSVRTIPLPDFVTSALAEHLASFPASESGLLFTMPDGKPISRNRFGDLWRAAVKAAGVRHGVRFHELRHYYASLLIRHGESVKTVQARLGHASAVETLNTYAHLWPDSEDRTRAAIDEVLRTALPAELSRSGK